MATASHLIENAVICIAKMIMPSLESRDTLSDEYSVVGSRELAIHSIKMTIREASLSG